METARDGARGSHNMASFHNVRPFEPSASAEGFRTSWISSSAAGLFHAAARTASAHAELAMLQGNHAAHSVIPGGAA